MFIDLSEHTFEEISARSMDRWFCAHIGASMHPTLHASDLLEVVPFRNKSLSLGDVILFQPPGKTQLVVHRICGTSENGISTRGDNNPLADQWETPQDRIVGRVVAAWRGEKRRVISGGRSGHLFASWIKFWRSVDRILSPRLHGLYHALSNTGWFQKILPLRLKPRVVGFRAVEVDEYRIIMGRWVIGHYDYQNRKWYIQRPFRLFIDQHNLPKPEDRDPG